MIPWVKNKHTWKPIPTCTKFASKQIHLTHAKESDSGVRGMENRIQGAKRTHRNPALRPCRCLVSELCPTLCNLMDCSPPGSSVHGILQARILEWVAFSFSRGSSQPSDRTHVSCIGRWILFCLFCFYSIWSGLYCGFTVSYSPQILRRARLENPFPSAHARLMCFQYF